MNNSRAGDTGTQIMPRRIARLLTRPDIASNHEQVTVSAEGDMSLPQSSLHLVAKIFLVLGNQPAANCLLTGVYLKPLDTSRSTEPHPLPIRVTELRLNLLAKKAETHPGHKPRDCPNSIRQRTPFGRIHNRCISQIALRSSKSHEIRSTRYGLFLGQPAHSTSLSLWSVMLVRVFGRDFRRPLFAMTAGHALDPFALAVDAELDLVLGAAPGAFGAGDKHFFHAIS